MEVVFFKSGGADRVAGEEGQRGWEAGSPVRDSRCVDRSDRTMADKSVCLTVLKMADKSVCLTVLKMADKSFCLTATP